MHFNIIQQQHYFDVCSRRSTAICRRPSCISEIAQGCQGGINRILKIWDEVKQKPSKNVRHTKNPGWSCLTLLGIWTIGPGWKIQIIFTSLSSGSTVNFPHWLK